MKNTVLYFILMGLSLSAWARPEYAAKMGINDCMVCHYNPSGAGPRTQNGKFYGTRSKTSYWDSSRKYWHLDMRMNGLYPQHPERNNNGMSMMGATVGATAPLVTDEKGNAQSQAVMTYDMGKLAPNGPHDAYVQFLSADSAWTLGRFLAPFGLVTDEHRAYTRLQTKTTINDYEMGLMYSHNFTPRVHMDLAVTTGFAQGGTFTGGTDAAPEQTGAAFINARFTPSFWPGFLGLSYSNHQSLLIGQVQSASFYNAISFERLSGYLPLQILGEVVWAQGWNNKQYNGINIGQFVGSDLALQAAWEKSTSIGAGGEVNYDLTPSWVLQYRYDRISLDKKFSGDVFERQGFGFKHFLHPNVNVLVRYEKATSTVAEVPAESVRANKDSFYFIIHAWL